MRETLIHSTIKHYSFKGKQDLDNGIIICFSPLLGKSVLYESKYEEKFVLVFRECVFVECFVENDISYEEWIHSLICFINAYCESYKIYLCGFEYGCLPVISLLYSNQLVNLKGVMFVSPYDTSNQFTIAVPLLKFYSTCLNKSFNYPFLKLFYFYYGIWKNVSNNLNIEDAIKKGLEEGKTFLIHYNRMFIGFKGILSNHRDVFNIPYSSFSMDIKSISHEQLQEWARHYYPLL